ncbi:HNH endonuclease signature motif containing protein [uncultured Nocardioides sp.]|uniref:HNH endonuclease signature motif containing protein n=1 Tax=uncultured Nocardioides sp. TaxID=198441 RepID=UPI002639BA7A|nr:HNH endonuclease signature motif containing protein [uncultured Nocardioides sp.]HRD60368.1 HNH endonuclease signature motif containing protein [Nocardioides sp.]
MTRCLVDRAQRIVKLLTAGGCQVDGCDAPPGLTHMHHAIEWSLGGRTDLDNTIMICGPHHARAHDPTYTLTPIPGDRFTFHPTNVSRPTIANPDQDAPARGVRLCPRKRLAGRPAGA